MQPAPHAARQTQHLLHGAKLTEVHGISPPRLSIPGWKTVKGAWVVIHSTLVAELGKIQ